MLPSMDCASFDKNIPEHQKADKYDEEIVQKSYMNSELGFQSCSGAPFNVT